MLTLLSIAVTAYATHFQYLKTEESAHRMYLYVSYDSQNSHHYLFSQCEPLGLGNRVAAFCYDGETECLKII